MASPKVHATLSASSAHRWLNAPPLPQLEKLFPKANTNFERHWAKIVNAQFPISKATTWKPLLMIIATM